MSATRGLAPGPGAFEVFGLGSGRTIEVVDSYAAGNVYALYGGSYLGVAHTLIEGNVTSSSTHCVGAYGPNYNQLSATCS